MTSWNNILSAFSSPLQWTTYYFILCHILHSFGSCPPPWDGSIDSRSKARSVSGVNVNSMRSGQKKYPCVRQQLWLQKPYLAPGSHRKIVLFRTRCKMLLMSFKFWFQKSRSSSVMLLLFSWKSMLSQKQRWFIAAEESSQVSPGSCKHFQKEDLDCS